MTQKRLYDYGFDRVKKTENHYICERCGEHLITEYLLIMCSICRGRVSKLVRDENGDTWIDEKNRKWSVKT